MTTRIADRPEAPAPTSSRDLSSAEVPIVTGAGDIQLVVRDLLGRETVIHQGDYAAPQLLAPGLFDFSYDAGALRENYGTQSNDYGAPFGTATYRRGITAGLTGEVRAELQRDRSAAGAAVTALAGQLGVVGVAAGFAASEGEQGAHYVTSFQRASPRGGAGIAWDHADRGFRPLGTSAEDVRSRDQLTAAAGLGVGAGIIWARAIRTGARGTASAFRCWASTSASPCHPGDLSA